MIVVVDVIVFFGGIDSGINGGSGVFINGNWGLFFVCFYGLFLVLVVFLVVVKDDGNGGFNDK